MNVKKVRHLVLKLIVYKINIIFHASRQLEPRDEPTVFFRAEDHDACPMFTATGRRWSAGEGMFEGLVAQGATPLAFFTLS